MIKVLQRKEEATMCSAHKVWGTVILRNTQDASYVSKCDQSDHQQSTIKNSQLVSIKQSLDSIGYTLIANLSPADYLAPNHFLSIMIDGSRFSTFCSLWLICATFYQNQVAHLGVHVFFNWEWIRLQFLAAWATKHGGNMTKQKQSDQHLNITSARWDPVWMNIPAHIIHVWYIYIPTSGCFLMVNVGEYTIHGC